MPCLLPFGLNILTGHRDHLVKAHKAGVRSKAQELVLYFSLLTIPGIVVRICLDP